MICEAICGLTTASASGLRIFAQNRENIRTRESARRNAQTRASSRIRACSLFVSFGGVAPVLRRRPPKPPQRISHFSRRNRRSEFLAAANFSAAAETAAANFSFPALPLDARAPRRRAGGLERVQGLRPRRARPPGRGPSGVRRRPSSTPTAGRRACEPGR